MLWHTRDPCMQDKDWAMLVSCGMCQRTLVLHWWPKASAASRECLDAGDGSDTACGTLP